MRPYDLIIHGTCFADLIFSEIPHLPAPGEEVVCGAYNFSGGGAYITAVAASRLGLRVAIIAAFGTGVLEQVIKARLEDEGVDTQWAYQTSEPLPFVTVAMNYEGDRGFLTYANRLEDANFLDHSQQVLERIEGTWLHLNAQRTAISLIDTAVHRHLRISMDVGWDKAWLQDAAIWPLLNKADLFMPNADEALAITHVPTAPEALKVLGQHVSRPVVTLGSGGCIALNENGQVREYPAGFVQAIDNTGAGDNFTAGVLAGLVYGRGFSEAIYLGTFCGQQSVLGLGGTTRSPNLSEANQFLRPYGWQIPSLGTSGRALS